MESYQIILKIATETLQVEREVLQALPDTLDDAFCAAVTAVASIPGRVVMTGVGKSALVAQKICATLNSTGTSAIFMHAADAVHGDLGMMSEGDLLWCISKSGETAEVRVLLPLVRQMGYPVLAFHSRKGSFLDIAADYSIHIPVPKEADPNNLAPTASTTAQMAMGDAIAMSLLALRGFTARDFSQFHPGGALGKRLYLKVSDLYVNNERPAVSPDDHLDQVILSMTSGRLGATAVLDGGGRAIGIITDGDLRRMLERGRFDTRTVAQDIMTPQPLRIASDELAATALSLMRERSVTQLLVSQSGRYVGMVHLHDILREGVI